MRRALPIGVVSALVFPLLLLLPSAQSRPPAAAAPAIRAPLCQPRAAQPASFVPAAFVAQAPVTSAAEATFVDAHTQSSFTFTATREGAIRMRGAARDLTIEKIVYPDGRFQMILQTPGDRLSVVLAPYTVDLERGGEHLHVEFAGAEEEDWLRVRALLAGSRALRSFRTLACNLAPATLETPVGIGMEIADATLGQLDGDVGAIGRLRDDIRRRRQARLRTVAFVEDDGGKGCYKTYEEEVVQAANEYEDCRHAFEWWSGWQAACALKWTLQAESAWFEFLACSAIPLKAE